MARAVLYNVHVGKNVASMKSYNNLKIPRLRINGDEDDFNEATTELDGFELPFVIIFVGTLLALMGYLFFTMKALPHWGRQTLSIAFWIFSFFTILYGIGRITRQTGLKIRSGKVEFWKRFFWYTRSKILTGPNYVCCTATRSSQETTCFIFDICLAFPRPEGLISIYSKNGYTQIQDNQGVQRKPYETVMQDLHEKAAEIADQMDVELEHTFKGGPLPDGLIKLFKKRGVDLESEDEE